MQATHTTTFHRKNQDKKALKNTETNLKDVFICVVVAFRANINLCISVQWLSIQ
jgi:hypothetical protein